VAFVDAAGQAAGAATATATLALFGVLAGVAAGQATVEGDSNPTGGGTAAGTSTATALGAIIQGGGGTAAGTSIATCAGGTYVIVTAVAHGTITAEASLFIDGAGQADGTSTLVATANRIVLGKGRVVGTSSFVWAGAVLPIHGTSVMVCNPVVDHYPPAIRAIVSPGKSFRYLERFERGGLPVFLCERSGPISPVWVRFTLYQVCPNGGTRWRKGPAQRTPAQGVVGEYYATGRAGESGQPGDWVIVWEFRRNLQSATQSKEMEFQVFDAVAAADPRDVTVRHRKFGWN